MIRVCVIGPTKLPAYALRYNFRPTISAPLLIDNAMNTLVQSRILFAPAITSGT